MTTEGREQKALQLDDAPWLVRQVLVGEQRLEAPGVVFLPQGYSFVHDRKVLLPTFEGDRRAITNRIC